MPLNSRFPRFISPIRRGQTYLVRAVLTARQFIRKQTHMTLSDWTKGIHHDGSEAYVSNPFPKQGEKVRLSLRVPSNAPIKVIVARVMFDGEFSHKEMTATRTRGDFHLYSVDVTVEQPRTEYSFKILTPEGAYYYNAFGVSRADSPVYYDFVLLAEYEAPHWVRDAIFYQIFPDRFANGDPANDVSDGAWEREGAKTRKMTWGEEPLPWVKSRSVDFFGGDLQGITQHLDHIEALGANALYLTPIWTAQSNHHYDATSFNEVDPHLGGNEALAELREATTQRNIRLMLDITPNHVGVSHYWLAEARKNPKSATAEYFFYNEEQQYFETWLGVASLIKLNYNSPRLRDEMYRKPDSALRRWLQAPYRIDGWRLDVANMTGNLKMTQLDHDVWQEMRPALKQDMSDLYLLGEYFQDGTPHTQGEELDAAMNYQGFNTPLRRWLGGEDLGVADGKEWGDSTLLPTEALALQWKRFIGAVPYVIALQQFNQLDSHDTTRILHVVNGDKALVKLGVALLMTYPGVPCIYYGGEIGMDGGKDPENRRCMNWDSATWDKNLFEHHKTMIALRKENPALREGGFQILHAEGDIVAFLRESTHQRIVVLGNRGNRQATFALNVANGGISNGDTLQDLLTGKQYLVKEGVITLEDVQHGQTLVLEVQ